MFRAPIWLLATVLLISLVPGPAAAQSVPTGAQAGQTNQADDPAPPQDGSTVDDAETWTGVPDEAAAGVDMADGQTKPAAGPQVPIPQPPPSQVGGTDNDATTPAQVAGPAELVSPDQTRVLGTGKPMPAVPVNSPSTLPAQGILNPPFPATGDANAHAVSSEAGGGQQQPLTVDEMRAHGYLGIPRSPAP